MAVCSTNRDVVILGGGPAGLAAGIALRQKGIACVVIDALQPPIDKGCGEGLMPDALEALKELGIEITEEDGHAFRGIRFVNATHAVEADFPIGAGIGVRRTRLHQRVYERARAAGVEVWWGSRAKLTAGPAGQRSIEVNGQRVGYDWLIGADGQSSKLRAWAGLHKTSRESLRFGFRRHYKVMPWSEYVEVHWGPCGQVYVTPVAPDSVCVAFITRDPQPGRGDFLEFFPQVASRVKGAAMMSLARGAVSATRKLRRIAQGRIALIGDASGSADAITGEGLAVSFRQAIALASAIENNDLGQYAQAHRQIGKLPHAMGELMLTMDRWPGMEHRAMTALAAQPDFFHQLLGVHVGAQSLTHFVLRHGLGLGWNLLQPRSS